MIPYVVSPLAQADLDGIWDYVAGDSAPAHSQMHSHAEAVRGGKVTSDWKASGSASVSRIPSEVTVILLTVHSVRSRRMGAKSSWSFAETGS